MQKLILFAAFGFLITAAACTKDPSTSGTGKVQFKLAFDPNQARLNNIGQPSTLPAGHAALSPEFRGMSIHYIELAPNALTPLGSGAILYKAPETTKGGANAIDFDQAVIGAAGDVIAEIPVKDIAPGTYTWIRASVAYQNYDIKYNLNNIPILGNLSNQSGTVSSFVGFNTYISNITPRQKTLAVNDDKLQGFWAFETNLSAPYDAYNQISYGQAPAGATTVVNPLALTSPIPPGSCVVTGQFAQPLVIPGEETGPIVVTLSFSVNKSFEWEDTNGNGQLDWYADGVTPGEKIVDMGLRGVVPSWK